jgi:hypothetical protein
MQATFVQSLTGFEDITTDFIEFKHAFVSDLLALKRSCQAGSQSSYAFTRAC